MSHLALQCLHLLLQGSNLVLQDHPLRHCRCIVPAPRCDGCGAVCMGSGLNRLQPSAIDLHAVHAQSIIDSAAARLVARASFRRYSTPELRPCPPLLLSPCMAMQIGVRCAHLSCRWSATGPPGRGRLAPSAGLVALVPTRRPGGSSRATLPICVAIAAYCEGRPNFESQTPCSRCRSD